MAFIPSCTILVGGSLQARFRLVWLSARKLGRFWLVPPIDQRKQTNLGLSLSRICIRVGYAIRVVNVNHQRRGTRVLIPQ